VTRLAGIRVVDLTQFLPGPMMTLTLADHGATVVKVEPPGGDPARAMPPFEAGQSVWFRNLNRGKTCCTIDLKTADGVAALWTLIAEADVLVEGFRPGVMARLGFDYATVAARFPRMVYCSITAFGQTGPRALHPAHDIVVQALSGFLSVNDGVDGTPVVPGVPSADMAAGLTALAGVLIALIGRETSGRGDHLDIAMFDALLPWSAHIAGTAIAGGPAARSADQRSLGGAAFYQVYATSCGGHIVLGGREAKFARALLEALGRPDLIAAAEAPAGAQQAALTAFLRTTFLMRSRNEWTTWFAARDIAFGPVLDFTEALADPAVAERGLVVCSDGAHQIAPAIRFAATPWSPPQAVA